MRGAHVPVSDEEESSHTFQAEIRTDGELFIFQHTKDEALPEMPA